MIRLTIILMIVAASTASADPAALRLGPGPHLLIDDHLIAESKDLRRVVNPPTRDLPGPIVTGKEDGCFQPYMTILHDPTSQRFRIWYGARTDDSDPNQSRLACMESDDGIQWRRPHRRLETPLIKFGASVLDDGPDFADQSKRYKFAWWAPPIPQGGAPGLKLATSPDGIKWTQLTRPGTADDVLIPHNHDINSIFRDPLRKRYLAIASTYVADPAWKGERRVTTQSVSEDLLNWSPLKRILVPDPTTEHDQTQFYAMDGFFARGDLLIGMVKVLRDDLKANDPPDPPDAYGVGYTTLAWTRDGETWVRDREPFFDRDPRKGSWDHAHAWIDEQVPVGEQVYLYYGGYARGHKVNRFEERQIGLVRMMRDRYVARQAEGQTGTFTTPLVVLDGEAITINADASSPASEIRVQVVDGNGKAIDGFAFDDCRAIQAQNAVNCPLTWRRSISELKDTPVRVQFGVTNARIFAFDLSAAH